MTADLAARLLAAIDATEADARAATQGKWRWVDPGGKVKQALVATLDGQNRWVVPVAQGDVYPSVHDAAHIARHDPASVLRRCAADRRIVRSYEEVGRQVYEHRGDASVEGAHIRGRWQMIQALVLTLAEGYGVTEEET